MLTIVENPTTRRLYALSADLVPAQMYAFDGTPILAPADVTTWPIIARNVPTVADWQKNPGDYNTLSAAVSIFTVERGGRKDAFKMGDNLAYLNNWLADAQRNPGYEAVSYQWIAAFGDRNAARSAAK